MACGQESANGPLGSRVFSLQTLYEPASSVWKRWDYAVASAQGVLEQLSALLIRRPYRYTPEMRGALYDQIRAALAAFGRSELPVVANMDFGHTSPQMVLPLGCRAAVDPVVRRIEILDAPTAES